MDFAWTDEQLSLRAEAAAVAADAVARLGRSNDSWINGYSKEFSLELGRRGWIGMTWADNRWSGSAGLPVGRDASNNLIWANMFNINADDISKAYGASSTDLNAGVVHRFMPQWSVRAAVVHFGKASTGNPTERGQSNSMWLGTLGLGYDIQPGWSVYGYTGVAQFARQGLAPLSMPSNSAFTGIDSRVSKNGNWAGLGMVYVF